jgi:hypothetical protein
MDTLLITATFALIGSVLTVAGVIIYRILQFLVRYLFRDRL